MLSSRAEAPIYLAFGPDFPEPMLASGLITNDAMNSRFTRISFRFMPFVQDDRQEIMPDPFFQGVVEYDRSSPGRRSCPCSLRSRPSAYGLPSTVRWRLWSEMDGDV